MRKMIIVFVLLVTNFTNAQSKKEIFQIDTNFRVEVDKMKGSAFMRYSGFVPRNMKDLLISMSGNELADSLLLKTNYFTLLTTGAGIFDAVFRKDYGLSSAYSPVLTMFFKYKLYDESLVKKAIVLFYFQYLTQNSIHIEEVIEDCLKGNTKQNSKAKKRLKKEESTRN